MSQLNKQVTREYDEDSKLAIIMWDRETEIEQFEVQFFKDIQELKLAIEDLREFVDNQTLMLICEVRAVVGIQSTGSPYHGFLCPSCYNGNLEFDEDDDCYTCPTCFTLFFQEDLAMYYQAFWEYDQLDE